MPTSLPPLRWGDVPTRLWAGVWLLVGGFGPGWDQMFVQSNYGVVTKAGVWMMPAPESMIGLDMELENADDLGWAVDLVAGMRRLAPDVELDVLLRMCAFPFLHVAADYEAQTHAADYLDVPRWLAEDVPELFSAPRLHERLTLYAIAYDVRELLAFPPAVDLRSLSPYHPLHRLQNTMRGAGHLAWLDRAVA